MLSFRKTQPLQRIHADVFIIGQRIRINTRKLKNVGVRNYTVSKDLFTLVQYFRWVCFFIWDEFVFRRPFQLKMSKRNVNYFHSVITTGNKFSFIHKKTYDVIFTVIASTRLFADINPKAIWHDHVLRHGAQ